MSKDLEEQLEDRLIVWGDFFGRRMQNAFGIGYPSNSAVYAILIGGGRSQYTGPRDLPSHPDAEEIEAWVTELADMSQRHLLWAKALRERYVTAPYKNSSTLGREAGVSERSFEQRVCDAKKVMLGMLMKSKNKIPSVANIIYLRAQRECG
jgi:hypothetical protein